MEYSEWDNIGRKKEWSPDATWMNLGNIIRSERSQSQKTTLLHDLIYMKCLEKANPEDRKQINGFQRLGAGRVASDC